VYGYYGQRTMIIGPRGVSQVAEFLADKSGEYEFYCQHFCGPLHLEMRGTFFVDPAGKAASLAVGDYDAVSNQEFLLSEHEREFIVGTNKLMNTLKEGSEPTI